MNKCILLPLHLYAFDPNGELGFKKKIQMYEFSILQTSKTWPHTAIIVICHGIRYDFFNGSPPINVTFYWSSKFQIPNKFGLFENDPAQRSIVYEGLKIAKTLGFSYIIKGRADSAILNRENVEKKISSSKSKLIITQQTSFSRPYLLGDCFMFGPIETMLEIWSPSDKYHKDGLKYFGEKICRVFNLSFTKILLYHTEFIDLNKIGAIDFRFTWKFKNEWKKDNDEIDPSLLYWGMQKKWIEYKDNKIIAMDRPNLITEKIFYSKIFRILLRIPSLLLVLEVYRRLFKWLFKRSLYKS